MDSMKFGYIDHHGRRYAYAQVGRMQWVQMVTDGFSEREFIALVASELEHHG